MPRTTEGLIRRTAKHVTVAELPRGTRRIGYNSTRQRHTVGQWRTVRPRIPRDLATAYQRSEHRLLRGRYGIVQSPVSHNTHV